MGSLQDQSNPGSLYSDEHLSLDFRQQVAMLDSHALNLTRKEYDLLSLLVQHAAEIVPREAGSPPARTSALPAVPPATRRCIWW